MNSSFSHNFSSLQTNIGSILAAVNPYKQIAGLYDSTAVDLYSKHQMGELPPHIFAVANECYRCLWKRHDSQCVLIRSVRAPLQTAGASPDKNVASTNFIRNKMMSKQTLKWFCASSAEKVVLGKRRAPSCC